MRVPIVARRQPSQLSLPRAIDVGDCGVGGAVDRQIPVVNKGSPSLFWLLLESELPDDRREEWVAAGKCDADFILHLQDKIPAPKRRHWEEGGGRREVQDEIDDENGNVVVNGPYAVTPAVFRLRTNESTAMNLRFAPPSAREIDCRLVLVVDNTECFSLLLRGRGWRPRLQLTHLDVELPVHEMSEKIITNNVLRPPSEQRLRTLENESGVTTSQEEDFLEETVVMIDTVIFMCSISML